MLTRRRLVAGSAMLASSAWAQDLAAPAVHRPLAQRWNTAISVMDFVGPDTGQPVATPLQAALDAAFDTGLPLIFPRGEWLVERTLSVRHTERARHGFPTIRGAGIGSTVLRATPFQGPMLGVRGVPEAPPLGTYFVWGGGVEGVDFIGAGANALVQTGLETMGWWNGTIKNCRFSRLGSHGIRAIGDLALDANPDFTASVLRVEGCQFERLGGWGFLDDNPIGAPGWVFQNCIFVLCAGGGAFVRSAGHTYAICSFSGCGFVDEHTPAPHFGVGLRIGFPPSGAIGRTRVVVAEFDSNKDAHVVVDRVASFLLEDVRFIHNDRFGQGAPCPPVAVQLGTDAPRSQAVGGRILRPVFRLDTPGPVTGYRLASVHNARNLVIEPAVWSQEYPGPSGLTKFAGFPNGAAAHEAGIVVE